MAIDTNVFAAHEAHVRVIGQRGAGVRESSALDLAGSNDTVQVGNRRDFVAECREKEVKYRPRGQLEKCLKIGPTRDGVRTGVARRCGCYNAGPDQRGAYRESRGGRRGPYKLPPGHRSVPEMCVPHVARWPET